MKQSIKIGMAILAVCTLLCACKKQESASLAEAPEGQGSAASLEDTGSSTEAAGSGIEKDTDSQKEAAGGLEDEQQGESALTVKDLVGEQFTFDGQRGSEEMLGYTMDVNYVVPEILVESEAAKAINEDIYTFCRDAIEPTQDELDFPTWYGIDYEAWLNGDILSIVISKYFTMDDAKDYAAFNYNVKEDKVTDNETLLRICGYTEDSFAGQMKKTIVYKSDEFMEYLFEAPYWSGSDVSREEKQSIYADYVRYRQNSLAAERMNLQRPMYLDETGSLMVLAEVDVPAGSGTWQAFLEPKKESRAKDFEISFENSLFLTYKDGIMKIRIEEGDWTGATFGTTGSCLEFGREYTVEGVCKDYIDGEMQFVLEGEYAIPVFVSDDGMVSALNIYDGALTGCFCLTEPVMGLTKIEALTETNASQIAEAVGETLFSQYSGFVRNVLGIYGQEGYSLNYGSREEGSGGYGYYLGFDEQEEGLLLYQSYGAGENDFRCYTGECKLLGMNEEGFIFASLVYADFTEPFDPEPHYSAFVLKRQSRWDDLRQEQDEWADFRSLGGFITLDTTGDLTALSISYG